MRRQRIIAVSTVAVVLTAVALTSGIVLADHSYGHHHHSHHGSSGFGFIPFWTNPWYYHGGGYFGPAYYGPAYYGLAYYGGPAYYGPPLVMAPFNPQPIAPARKGLQGGAAAGNGRNRPERKTRMSNPSVLARAKEFLKFGDEHFRAQEFSDAYQRYKKAASAAPDVAEAHFRQGFSLLALGSYSLASKAFLRGLAIKPDWARSKFRLDELYGANRLAKTKQLEQLAAAAGNEPANARLMFLLGVELFFDGQGERARKFFVRAADLGEDRTHLAGFFKALGPAPGAAPVAPKRNGRLEL